MKPDYKPDRWLFVWCALGLLCWVAIGLIAWEAIETLVK
jgi:hypothetical protein